MLNGIERRLVALERTEAPVRIVVVEPGASAACGQAGLAEADGSPGVLRIVTGVPRALLTAELT